MSVERPDRRARCENCGGTTSFRPRFDPALKVVECQRCGGWSYTGPTVEPGTLYDEGYFTGGEYFGYERARGVHRKNFGRKLRLLEAHGWPRGAARVVEIGSATGEFLALAQDGGAEVLGIEASAYCREIAGRRGLASLGPDDPSVAERVSALRPNVLVGWDVWEHLQEPAEVFDSLLAAADARVLVALTTVDASSAVARLRGHRWRQFHPPTHLHYPTRRSLRTYFESRGLRVVYHRSFGYYRPLGEYVRAVLPAALRPRVEALETAALELPVYLNLHDTQLAIASRGG